MKTIFFYVKDISFLKGWVDPLCPFFQKLGYNLKVLHITKLTKEAARSDGDIKRNYEVIDISFKSTKDIVEMFNGYKPIGMIVLTFRSLFDIFVNRIAQYSGVKTLYLEHGFFADLTALQFRTTDIKASIRKYLHFIFKYFCFLLTNLKRLLHEVRLVYKAMKKDDYSYAKYDYALFYANYGYQKADKLFKFDKKNVFFAGYPIVRTKTEVRNIEKYLVGKASIKKRILYIQQALIVDKISKITYEKESIYLANIISISKNLGYDFILQVHPRESKARYGKLFKDKGVQVEQSANIEQLVISCDIVLGHFSTALFFAVYFKKPLLLLYYPGLSDIFLDYFKDVGVKIDNKNALAAVLSNREKCNVMLEKYDAFIDNYVGRDNSFEHQAEKIVSIFNKVRQESLNLKQNSKI